MKERWQALTAGPQVGDHLGKPPGRCVPEPPQLHPGARSCAYFPALQGAFTPPRPRPTQSQDTHHGRSRPRLGAAAQIATGGHLCWTATGALPKETVQEAPQGSHRTPKHQHVTHSTRDAPPKLEELFNRNTNDSTLKRTKGLNKHFSKDDIQMTNKHSKPSGNANQNHNEGATWWFSG